MGGKQRTWQEWVRRERPRLEAIGIDPRCWQSAETWGLFLDDGHVQGYSISEASDDVARRLAEYLEATRSLSELSQTGVYRYLQDRLDRLRPRFEQSVAWWRTALALLLSWPPGVASEWLATRESAYRQEPFLTVLDDPVRVFVVHALSPFAERLDVRRPDHAEAVRVLSRLLDNLRPDSPEEAWRDARETVRDWCEQRSTAHAMGA